MALGTQLYYSSNNNPATETWTLETAKIKITIKDAAIGKPRTMEAIIVNTVDPLTGQHSKELIYTSFRRVKVVEYNTNNTIFIGRVEISQPMQDPSFGQILVISARDYLQTLLDRKINSNYGSSGAPMTRSTMISQILTEYNTPNATITTGGISSSPATGTSDLIFRQYAGSNKTVARAIEELAQEEPWSSSGWPSPNGVMLYNGSTYSDKSTISSVFQSFLGATNHYYYFGQTAPFVGVNFTNIASSGNYGTLTWEYSSGGAFVPFSNLLQTANLNTTGVAMVRWEVPLSWATGTVNSLSNYWVRCKASSVGAVASLKADCAIGVGFNYYIDENGVFQYFRKGSRPAGGPVANGLTISLSPSSAAPLTQRQMLANYEFTSQPKEIITRVYVKGTAADTGNVVSASACNEALEKEYNTVKEKWDFISGSGMNTTELTAYAQARAKSLLYATSSTVNRGIVSVVKYPYYTVLNSQLIGPASGVATAATGSNTLDTITFCKFTASASGNMDIFRIKMASADTIRTAIYADHALTPGSPGIVLKTSEDAVAASAGWNDVIIPPVTLVAGTVYWLAINTQASNTICRASSGTGTRKFIATSFYNAFTDNPVTTSSDTYISMVQGYSATFTLIRAGDLVHAKCDMTDTDMDFEVTDIEYAEPNVSAKISLISPTAGRGQEPDDMSNILTRLNDGDNAVIPSARIGDLVAKKITAGEILAGDIVVDIGLGTGGTLHSANYEHEVSGWMINYDGFAEFQDVRVRGKIYNSYLESGNYLNISGGAIQAGSGHVLIDANGVGIIEDVSSVTAAQLRFASTSAGLTSNTACGIYQSNGWLEIMGYNALEFGSYGNTYFNAAGGSFLFNNGLSLRLPNQNTVPAGSAGCVYYDTAASAFYGYAGSSWVVLGGATSSHAPNTDWKLLSSNGGATLFDTGNLVANLTVSNGININATGSMTINTTGSFIQRMLGSFIISNEYMASVTGRVTANNRLFLTSVNNCVHLQAPLGMVMPTAASDPAGGLVGQMYFNTASNVIRYWNGAWSTIGGAGGSYLPLAGGTMTDGAVINSPGTLFLQPTNTLTLQSANSVVKILAPLGMVMPVGYSNPAAYSAGQMYYNPSTNTIQVYSSTGWGTLGGAGGVGAYLPLSGGTMTGGINFGTAYSNPMGLGELTYSNYFAITDYYTSRYIRFAVYSGIGMFLQNYDHSTEYIVIAAGDNLWLSSSNKSVICTAPYGLSMPQLSAPPPAGTANRAGSLYYSSGSPNTIQLYNGASWIEIGGSISGSYLPLAGGTMSGPINMYAGGTIHGNGVFTIDALTALTLSSPNTSVFSTQNLYLAAGASTYGVYIGNTNTNNNYIYFYGTRVSFTNCPVKFYSVTADPAFGLEGDVIYRTDTHKIRYYGNGGWIDVATGTGAGGMSNHALDANPYHTALSNNTNFNVSTTAHGFCPIANVGTNYFLRGDGTWAIPPAGGGSVATDTIWDSVGDLAVGTGSNTATAFSAVGIPNGYVLTRHSGYPLGVQWLTPAAATWDATVSVYTSVTRALNTNYYNSTGKVLFVIVSARAAGGTNSLIAYVGSTNPASIIIGQVYTPNDTDMAVTFMVPKGWYYNVVSADTWLGWSETALG